MRHVAFPLLLLALVAGTGCQHTAPATGRASAAPIALPSGADDNLNAVLWMQSSPEYQAATRTVYQAAAARLPEALGDARWDALAAADRVDAERAPALPPAVILDLDETVLDNSPYQARMVRDGVEFDPASWGAWVEERRARAVPGVLEFARAATARGVTLVYISNRDQHMAAATLDNLRAVGMPVAGDQVFLGRGTVVPGCEQAGGSDKSCRRRQVARQYRVLMQFGDQLGDFVELPEGTPVAERAAADRHASWFGERWWLLPNPSYGGWEAAPYARMRDLPRQERRALKRAALRVE